MEHRSAYDAEIANMPPGLERAILRVLSFHIGKDKAIGRMELVRQVGQLGCETTERQLREQIKQMRRGKDGQPGYLICSMAGEDGGYFFPANHQEYNEFRQIEFAGKIADMAETMSAMDKAALKTFGIGVQPGLF